MSQLSEMMARYAQAGRVDAILLRPERHAPMQSVERVQITEAGLDGDRARAGKRALSLIQAEHLPVIAALAGLDKVAPETLRRNIVVSGLNLAAFKGTRVRLGSAVIELTVPCHPCSQMEKALGHGGYSAMRGHGGMCATVIEPGELAIGDTLQLLDPAT